MGCYQTTLFHIFILTSSSPEDDLSQPKTAVYCKFTQINVLRHIYAVLAGLAWRPVVTHQGHFQPLFWPGEVGLQRVVHGVRRGWWEGIPGVERGYLSLFMDFL